MPHMCIDDDEHNTDNNFLLLFADIGILPNLLDGLNDVDVLHIALDSGPDVRWKCAPASPWDGALHSPVRLLVCFRRLQTYAGSAVTVMTVQSSMGVATWTFCPLSQTCALTQGCFAVAVWRKRDQSSHRTPQHTKVVGTVCSVREWSSECCLFRSQAHDRM